MADYGTLYEEFLQKLRDQESDLGRAQNNPVVPRTGTGNLDQYAAVSNPIANKEDALQRTLAVMNTLIGAGASNAEAARGRRSSGGGGRSTTPTAMRAMTIAPASRNYTAIAAPDMGTDPQLQRDADRAATQAELAQYNAQNEAQAQKDALMSNIAAMTQGTTSAGPSRAYAVPPELQDKYGSAYLTNQILPTAETPEVANPSMTRETVPNGQLTAPENVDWQRMIAGNYQPQYAGGKEIPPMPPDQARLAIALQTGDPKMIMEVLKPEKPEKVTGHLNDKGNYITESGKDSGVKAPDPSQNPSGRDFITIETPEGQALLNKTTGEIKHLGVQNKMPTSISKKIEDQQNLLGYLERIRENYKLAGKSASGPIQARIGWAQERVGGLSPAEIALRRDVADFQDRILRERSGAAINESEAERLRQFTPDLKMNDDVFKQRIDDVIAATKSIQQTTLDQAKSRGYLLDKGNQQKQNAQSEYSPNDIAATARKYGITEDEVRKRLQGGK